MKSNVSLGVFPVKTIDVMNLVNNNYHITATTITKIKNVYKLQSYNEEYCLKVIHYEYAHFLFILEAIKHLNRRGFNNVPEIINTVRGEEYIKIQNHYAYLTKWVEARECNYDNPFDIILASATLAKLHKKSENFEVLKDMAPRIYWFRWVEIFNTRKCEILDFKNKINNKDDKTEFDCKYLKMIDKEINTAGNAVSNLIDTEYYNKMLLEINKKGFCHHDYAHHNVLIDRDNELCIIDFDYCILDTHLHDLSSLLIRKMKNGKWDLNNALFILDAYNSIYPIEISDIPIIGSFIEFPQDFWQLGIQYYWEKQPWGEEFFISKLDKISFDIDEKKEFLKEFRNLKYRG